MNNIFKVISAILLASFMFFSCSKDEHVDKKDNLVRITFSAEKAGVNTKTAAVVGETSVSYIWTTEDLANIKLFEVDSEGTITKEVSNPTVTKVSDTKLTISAEVEPGEYTFRAVLCDPSSYTSSGNDYSKRSPKIKASQHPNGTTNFDPTADILVSDDKTITVAADGATTGAMELIFHRHVVVNMMTLKNLNPGEKISRVVITSSTGNILGYLENGQMKGQLQGTTITLNYDDVIVPSGGTFPVYFVCMENTGIALTIDVTTDQFTYSKSFAEGKTIDFTLGYFIKFGVALPSGTPASEVANGQYFITGAVDDDVYTANAYSGGNNLTSQQIVLNVANEKITYFEGIEDCLFTFKRVTEGDYTGKYTIQDVNGLYLYAAGGNGSSPKNYLKGEAAPDANGNAYWSVSKNNDGTYSIESAGNAAKNILRFNSTNSNGPIFSCYGSGQNPVTLYPASWCTIVPCISVESPFLVTSNADTYSITVSRTNYSGEINVSVPSGCGWITATNVASNTNTFTIDVSANTGEARSATLTLSGDEIESVELVVNQDGIVILPLPFEETFSTSQGDFTIENVTLSGSLTYVWKHDSKYKYMKASSYNGSENPAESWLVSPILEIPSLSSGESIKLKFSQVVNAFFGTIENEATLMVKEIGGDWTKVSITYPTISSGNFSDWDDQIVDISSYAGKRIQFAFKYVGTSEHCGTWEIKNVSVKKYEPFALSSISVNNPKTIFTEGETFTFGGTVTANYNDGTSADVTESTSTTFSGYDMSSLGNQTVIVSYTEGGVTKTTSYGITVNSASSEAVVYTLDGSITGGTNGYATVSDITQNNILWKVKGNTTMNPWRIGGKNLTNEDRTIYSTSTINKNISKIEITHGTASNITVNSMTVIVSQNSDFSSPISTLTPSFVANGTVTVNRPTGADWSNCYFKIIYNVSAGDSNVFIQFASAVFTGK